MNNKPFAEIIESTTTIWTAHSWQWDNTPQFGSCITIQHNLLTLIGIVFQIKTGSSEASRYPFPYKKTEAELHAEQPQIFGLFQTTFLCYALGYIEKGKMQYALPPYPPKIHAFVSTLDESLIVHMRKNALFLHVLYHQCPEAHLFDELLLALLHIMHLHQPLTHEYIIELLDTYILLIANDYRRLKLFTYRLQTNYDL